MAAVNGVNFAKEFVNVPSEQAEHGVYGGRVRVIMDYVLAGGAVATDVVSLGKLPAGARVIRCSNIGGGSGATYSVAPGIKYDVETLLTLTVGTTPGTDVYGIIEYVLD